MVDAECRPPDLVVRDLALEHWLSPVHFPHLMLLDTVSPQLVENEFLDHQVPHTNIHLHLHSDCAGYLDNMLREPGDARYVHGDTALGHHNRTGYRARR